MTRAVSNLLIVLVMAAAVTVVVALSPNTARLDDADGAARPLADPAPPEDGDDAPAETFGEQATDALKEGVADDATEATVDQTAAAETSIDETAADSDDASVLGAVQVQEGDGPEEALADTGPIEAGQWIVIALAVMATGGLAHNASRDHAEGLLTVLP